MQLEYYVYIKLAQVKIDRQLKKKKKKKKKNAITLMTKSQMSLRVPEVWSNAFADRIHTRLISKSLPLSGQIQQIFFLNFPRKQALTFHANCPLRIRQSLFSKKIKKKKIQIVVC